MTDTVIIGAGPYGLSLAAHLAAANADFRIFGAPLDTWRHHMPKGMLLKSDGFASNLSSPHEGNTLKAWSARNGRDYADTGMPVALSTFLDYAAWFQTQHVPMLENRQVASLARGPRGFTVELDSGEKVDAARVIMAVGITWFSHMPEVLQALPPSLASHASAHHDMSAFAGRRLAILGAGSSAVDMAVLADEAGAEVTLIARANVINYHAAPDPDTASWLRAVTQPASGIGPGWRSFVCANAPMLFRAMPEPLRLRAVRRHLGPAPGWFMQGKLKASTLLGHHIEKAVPQNGGVLLRARHGAGTTHVEADHILAATGYRPDLRRLPFLQPALRERIAHTVHAPKLSPWFETSVPGLYATGPLAANTFGPLMRFMVGAEYAAPRIASHLAKTTAKARAVA